jgi:hypothetical protein
MIIVTPQAYNRLSPRTKAELMDAVFGPNSETTLLGQDVGFNDGHWEDAARLTPGQIERLIDDATSLYEGSRLALKLIAEHGPIIHSTFIKENCLDEKGQPYWPDDLGKFQGGTTRRVRAVTGDKHAMLLAWPEWTDGEGYYGVTPETHRSLRIYFNLD